jgi:PhzF family phenazine biosynthesis protein
MSIPIYFVDAFTTRLFSGNPAAVCVLDNWLPDSVMQNIAAENNLSETAFFVKENTGFHIRWFTPNYEIDLCGHGTLATAHVIFKHLNYIDNKIIFKSRSGELIVTKTTEGLTLNFPICPTQEISINDIFIDGLGVKPIALYKGDRYLVVLANEQQIRDLQINIPALAKIDLRSVIITAPGNDCDFVVRYFTPKETRLEDPVTGSAQSYLVPYWAQRLNKTHFHVQQLSKRGGELFSELSGDRVLISGQAVDYLQGFIAIE